MSAKKDLFTREEKRWFFEQVRRHCHALITDEEVTGALTAKDFKVGDALTDLSVIFQQRCTNLVQKALLHQCPTLPEEVKTRISNLHWQDPSSAISMALHYTAEAEANAQTEAVASATLLEAQKQFENHVRAQQAELRAAELKAAEDRAEAIIEAGADEKTQ